jgi:hypothetical protein
VFWGLGLVSTCLLDLRSEPPMEPLFATNGFYSKAFSRACSWGSLIELNRFTFWVRNKKKYILFDLLLIFFLFIYLI